METGYEFRTMQKYETFYYWILRALKDQKQELEMNFPVLVSCPPYLLLIGELAL